MAVLLSRNGRPNLREVLREHWPHDKSVDLVVRAATTPATATDPAWAAEIVGMGVADFLDVLGPASAGATLLSRGLQFRFDGTGWILVHGIVADKANATFVREGYPIPVHEFATGGGVKLEPRKFVAIAAFTSEALRHTTPNIELLVRQVLSESVGAALDDKLFDAVAGDETRPAGLRYSVVNNSPIAALTESAATGSEAMAADVGTLVGAVAAVAGNNPIIFIAAPKQAAALRLWARPNFNYEVLSSGGLTDKTVLCVAANALASACDPVPRFETTTHAALHFDNASPRDIDTQAVSETVKSLFQNDLVGLRAIMKVSWGLRNEGGLAWLEDVVW